MSDGAVTLREVTAGTVRDVCRLEVAPHQKGFVAPNAFSIAQAYFDENAWFRAIYADEVAVGFVMLSQQQAAGKYYIWRFMVAADQQGKGYGRRALQLLVQHVRRQPSATALTLSYVPGDGGPAGFYSSLGFVETGEIDDGERVMRLELQQ